MDAKGNSAALSIFLALVLAACASQTNDLQVGSSVEADSSQGASSSPAVATQAPTGTAQAAPSPSQTQVDCTFRSGAVEEYQIPWKGESLTGRIYTPPCYRENPDLVYPVLYLLHGATETEQQWEDLGLYELVDRLINQDRISPLLIVMPRELTWVSLQENPFGDQLVQGVLPWVDRHFRTLPDRQHRAVGGVSRGGNWAVRLGLLHWGLFGSLGAHSTPLFYGDLNKVSDWLEDIPPDKVPRIYLDIGEDDSQLTEAQNFRDQLIDAGLDPEWQFSPGLHDEVYWSSHLEDYLLWYSSGWNIN